MSDATASYTLRIYLREMKEDKYDKLRQQMIPQVQNPIQDAEKFLMTYFGNGDSDDEIKKWAKSKGYSPADQRGLSAIDLLLESNEYDKELLRLVVWVANHPLDQPDVEHAKLWLKEKRDWIGEVLGY